MLSTTSIKSDTYRRPRFFWFFHSKIFDSISSSGSKVLLSASESSSHVKWLVSDMASWYDRMVCV